MLITAPEAETDKIVNGLKKHELGINAAVIGEIVDGDIGKAILFKGMKPILLQRPKSNFLPRSC